MAKRILLIDDDKSVVETLTMGLQAAGYVVVPAYDGDAALALFDENAIDGVITDIVMPEREGIGTIRALRAKRATIPILAISGSGSQGGADYLTLASKLGADAILHKPFAIGDLLKALRTLKV